MTSKLSNGLLVKYEYDPKYTLKEYEETSTQESEQIYEAIKLNFNYSNKTKDLQWRKKQLNQLRQGILELDKELVYSACKDFKTPDDASAELLSVLSEITSVLEQIDKWTSPDLVAKPLVSKMDTAYIQYEPFGVVLIVCPWNFPYILSLLPLIGCIAAGNAAILKPSELTPNSAACLTKLVRDYLDIDFIQVINGGPLMAEKLLKWRWDFIFYTGNSNVAKLVQKAAAEHLTPTALELGGKNPVFIDPSLSIGELKTVARRITWGKLLNCGQICISPDYILIHPDMKEQFIQCVIDCIQAFYTEDAKSYGGYSRIVNEKHMKRLINLLPSQKDEDQVIYGGTFDLGERYFEPTIIDVKAFDKANCMKEEIFGPILPIISVESQGDALTYVKKK